MNDYYDPPPPPPKWLERVLFGIAVAGLLIGLLSDLLGK